MKIRINRILFLTTFLSAAVPMLVVGIISLYFLKTHLRQEMETEGSVFSRAIAEQVRTYLSEPVRILSLSGDHIKQQLDSTPDVERFFDDVLRSHDYIESIYRLDSAGIVRQVGRRHLDAGNGDLYGMDFSTQDSFRAALRDKRASWSTSQTLSGGEPTLALCLPVGEAVLLANLRLAELSRIINKASSSHYYTAFIVEKGGRIIAHPDGDLVARRENVGTLPLADTSRDSIASGRFDFHAITYHATVVPIRETQWRLVVAEPLDIAEQPVRYLEKTFLLGIGFMLLLVSGVAGVSSRIIIRPIRRLEEQSLLVAAGRFEEIVPVASRCSEIVMLSDTIGAMANEVQQRELRLHDQNDELQISEEMLRTQIKEYQETHDQLLATEEMLRVQIDVYEKNQQLLKESNARLETMIHSSPLAIISLDRAGKIILWNRTAIDLFGCSAEEIHFTLQPLFPVAREYTEFLSRLVTEPGLRLFEQPLLTFRSRPLVVSLVSAPLVVADGETDFILMLEDVTRQRQIEEQLRQAQKMDVVGQLAGGVAHDFNNMLAGIMASAELLKHRMAGDDKNMKMVDTILNAASRSADLTHDLMAFSRKGAIAFSPVVIHETITAVVSLLERTIDKRIWLRTRLEASNPVVLGDAALLQNALLNLGINARDAMPEGGTLTYSTSYVFLDEAACTSHKILLSPGMYLQIAVADTGIGIPKQIIGHIFEPFFTTKEQGKGTGLGLAAVYGAAVDHHGSIHVYSEPGQGTVFKMFLPLSETESVVEKRGEIVRGTGGILLVDDEEILRTVGGDLLEELGYTVYLAEDGAQALVQYERQRHSIALVILDMVMPGLNGKETFLRLREIDPDIRVLFCSGFHREGTVPELIQLGARGFIQKPYNTIDLSRAVMKALESL